MKRTATWLIMAVLFAAMGGCISSPNDEMDAPYVLHIRTSFVPEESNERAMVPAGAPAVGVRLFIGPRTPIEVQGDEQIQEWESDPPCPRELVEPHQVVRHRCEDHPRLTNVVLPPIATDDFHGERRLVYLLNGDGEIWLHSYEPFSSNIRLRGPYSEELMEMRIAPDDSCRELVWNEGFKEINASLTSGGKTPRIDFSQSGSITLGWSGFCDDPDAGSSN